ncbi:MAG: PP2C family protein-serine/threonine phosphatase [Isosphaerales bacterium]
MNDEGGQHLKDTEEYVLPGRRASPFYETEPKVRVHVEVAGRSHPGKVRENNEDNYLAVRRYRGREVLLTSVPEEILEPTEDHAFTFAVADGMGGCNFGELASLIAVQTGWELGGGEIKWSMKINDREVEELRQKAETFFQLIDDALHAEVRASPRLAGMGTTLTICYSTGPELFVMHVGDSRAYLYRDGVLRRLTRDHTLAQRMIDTGVAEPGSREVRRVRHVLTNVLGGPNNNVTVDVEHFRICDGDTVLLCTDGLTDMVADDDIAHVLGQHHSPADACNVLLELALESGGKDNVTVVLARYQIEDPSGQADKL